MKFAFASLLAAALSLWAGNQQLLQPVEFNVNSRYTVEAVDLAPDVESRISRGLRQDLEKLIGQRFNATALNQLAGRIRDELHVPEITQKLLRGSVPDHVLVVIRVPPRTNPFELSVPRFLYQSNQGWSAGVDGTYTSGDNRVTASLISNGDELAERYSGLEAKYENRRLGTDRVRMSFEFDTYHELWNRASESAAVEPGMPDLYRTRMNIEPMTTLVVARPLTVSFGMGFQDFSMQSPGARAQAANAGIARVHYLKTDEDTGDRRQSLEADYSLRVASKALSSDFVYTRHRWELRYSITRGRHTVIEEAVAGLITGRAPLFERYVLGTSSMLRGWNKYDLDPLGGSRVAYNSVDYRYGMLELFYDMGAIWDPGQDVALRHSIGVGLRRNAFMLAMAFPVRDGRSMPVFMVGMNY